MTLITIRPLAPADWPAVETIYREGIATGNATFEAQPPSWENFDASKLAVARLVAVDNSHTVLGWAAVSPTSARPVYRGVVEHSVYVAGTEQGKAHSSQLSSKHATLPISGQSSRASFRRTLQVSLSTIGLGFAASAPGNGSL